MAIFHLHVKNISRSDGRSAVAAAAYRAGETLPNETEERDSAFGGRRDVLYAEIRVPDGAPAWMSDRAKLWNAVEAAEKRKDARLAKEIEFALPRDLPRPQWLKLVRTMADAYARQGHVVDLAIHDDGRAHNPHAHLMLTTRVVSGAGFGGKIRSADGLQFVTEARALWARTANQGLAAAGSIDRIDHRSHAEAGHEKTPATHRRPDRHARNLRRATMDNDLLEAARRDLLAMNPTTPQPFPHLAQRPDWPPASRDAPTGLSPAEQAEFKLFWDSVDDRAAMLGRLDDVRAELQAPVPDPDGNLIDQQTRNAAEDRMLAEMERPVTKPSPDREAYWWETQGARSPTGELPTPAPEDDHDNWWRNR